MYIDINFSEKKNRKKLIVHVLESATQWRHPLIYIEGRSYFSNNKGLWTKKIIRTAPIFIYSVPYIPIGKKVPLKTFYNVLLITENVKFQMYLPGSFGARAKTKRKKYITKRYSVG